MADTPIKKSVAFDFPVVLFSASTGLPVTDPTLAAGDVKIQKDYGAEANVTTLAAVTPSGTTTVKVSVSTAEAGADDITIKLVDAAGGEWLPVTIHIKTSSATFGELATQSSVDTIDTNVDAIQAKTDDLTFTVANVLDTNITHIQGTTTPVNELNRFFRCFESATADSGTTTTMVDSTRSEADDYWIGATLMFRDGNNVFLSRVVTDFDAATDTITVSPAFPNAIQSGDDYVLAPLGSASAADVLDSVIEGSITLKQSLQLSNAGNAGKTAGMATTTATLRDLADSKDRVTATVDADGNRTATTVSYD